MLLLFFCFVIVFLKIKNNTQMKEKDRLKKLHQLCYGENPPPQKTNSIEEDPIEKISRIKVYTKKSIDTQKQKLTNALFFKIKENNIVISGEDEDTPKNYQVFYYRSILSELLLAYTDAKISIIDFARSKISKRILEENLSTFEEKIKSISNGSHKFAISTQRLPFVLEYVENKTKRKNLYPELLKELKPFPTFISIKDFSRVLYKIVYRDLFKDGVKIDGWY